VEFSSKLAEDKQVHRYTLKTFISNNIYIAAEPCLRSNLVFIPPIISIKAKVHWCSENRKE